jgi:hypothetical protein
MTKDILVGRFLKYLSGINGQAGQYDLIKPGRGLGT